MSEAQHGWPESLHLAGRGMRNSQHRPESRRSEAISTLADCGRRMAREFYKNLARSNCCQTMRPGDVFSYDNFLLFCALKLHMQVMDSYWPGVKIYGTENTTPQIPHACASTGQLASPGGKYILTHEWVDSLGCCLSAAETASRPETDMCGQDALQNTQDHVRAYYSCEMLVLLCSCMMACSSCCDLGYGVP